MSLFIDTNPFHWWRLGEIPPVGGAVLLVSAILWSADLWGLSSDDRWLGDVCLPLYFLGYRGVAYRLAIVGLVPLFQVSSVFRVRY